MSKKRHSSHTPSAESAKRQPTAVPPPTDLGAPDKPQELLDAIRSLGDHRLLIVVDRGLILFSKFVAVQIAIFGIIGIFFFGADFKDTLKDVRETRIAVTAAQQELQQSQAALTKAKETLHKDQASFGAQLEQSNRAVSQLQKRVATLQVEANIHLARIRGLRSEAESQFVLIKQLTVDQQANLTRVSAADFKAVIRTENLPAASTDIERKQAQALKLWTNGVTLRIRFLDGTKEQRDEVIRIANEWTAHANVTFSVVESGPSHVRVTLRPKNWSPEWPLWAYQGTESLGVDQEEPTIGLDVANELHKVVGFDFADAKARKGYVLREFGFVLGLIDEMRNPNVPWTSAEAVAEFGSIGVQQYLPFKESELPGYREFDARSVVLGFGSKALMKGEVETGGKNYELSEGDRKLIGRLYPR